MIRAILLVLLLSSTASAQLLQLPRLRRTDPAPPTCTGPECRTQVVQQQQATFAPAPVSPPTVVCPRCGRVHAPGSNSPGTSTPALSGQAVAQARANFMARNNYRNHPPRSAGNFASVGNFEGVGWSSRQNAPRSSIPTCRPSGPSGAMDDNSARLTGDAVAYGRGGSYRVRIWDGPVRRASVRRVVPTRIFRRR